MSAPPRSIPPRRRRRRSIGQRVHSVVVYAVLAFLLLPTLVVVWYSFYSTPSLEFPPKSFTIRWYSSTLTQRDLFLEPMWTSLMLALQATLISTVLGTVAAIALRHVARPWLGLIRGLHLAPLFVPTLVTGFALMLLFNQLGLWGSYLGLLIGHIIITLPYVFVSVFAGVARLDQEIEEASLSLGAGPARTVGMVTVPLLGGSIVSGAIFGFLISFDQLELTLFLASPSTVTLPVEIFSYVQQRADPTVAAVSTIIVVINVVLLAILQRLGGLSRRPY
jgi:putative spermidine/putrescine transport system permease protein